MFEVDFQMEGLMRTLAECQRRGLDLEPPLKQFGREKRKQIAQLVGCLRSPTVLRQGSWCSFSGGPRSSQIAMSAALSGSVGDGSAYTRGSDLSRRRRGLRPTDRRALMRPG